MKNGSILKSIVMGLTSLMLVTSFTACTGDSANYTLDDVSNNTGISTDKITGEEVITLSEAKASSKIVKTEYVVLKSSGNEILASDIMIASFANINLESGLAERFLIEEGVNTSNLSTEEIDKLAINKLLEALKEVGNVEGIKSSAYKGAYKGSLLDKLKDKLVTSLDTTVGQYIMSASFSLVLEDIDLTKTMIKLAIDSQTITDIMVDALKDDWDLTIKMRPMLENDEEFGVLFLTLAEVRPSVAHLTFQLLDSGLYNSVTKAMINSKTVTLKMSGLMNTYALDYLVLENQGKQGLYGNTDNFASLFFSDMNIRTNQRFYKAMFQYSESTNNFVLAFNKVYIKDKNISTTFLDLVFLGQKSTVNGVTEDLNTSYQNIYAMVGAMYTGMYVGVGEQSPEGFTPYTSSFLGLYNVIEGNKLYPYGKRFLTAGYKYYKDNNLNLNDLLNLTNTIFGTEFTSLDFPDITTLPEMVDLNLTLTLNNLANWDKYLYDFSNGDFAQTTLYGNTLTYVPNWMVQKDWLKIPFTYEDTEVNFEQGVLEIYLVSPIDDIEIIKNTSGSQNVVKLSETILTDSEELYVYRMYIQDSTKISFWNIGQVASWLFL